MSSRVTLEKTLHTPGPWVSEGSDPNEGWDGFRIRADAITPDRRGWGDIGTVTGPQSNPSSVADARLIAAAPDLLHALDCILWRHAEDEFIPTEFWDAAKEAIAKARGVA